MPIEEYRIHPPISIRGFFSAFEAYYPADYIFSGESHDFWEMVYVIDGALGVSADDRIYTLSKNEIIFHKPMEFHKLWSIGGVRPRLFICSFSAEGLEAFEGRVFHLTPEGHDALFGVLSFLRSALPYSPNKRINPFMDLLVHREDAPRNLQSLANRMELFLLAAERCGTMTLSTLEGRESTVYKTAVRVMEECVHENPTVAAIADKCLVSESYLKNIFSKYAGLGIHKYFLHLKINRACAMLRSGLSVTEIAERLGFATQNYFSTVFRRETSLTPSEYRQRTRV